MVRARKSSEAFRTISEVAEILDIPAHVLRFWESRFTQIKPVKRGGGRRYYRPQDIALLSGIQTLLHKEGLTIKGAQKVLKEEGVRHVSALGELGEDHGLAIPEAPEPAAALSPATVQPDTPPAPPPASAPQPQPEPAEHQFDLFAEPPAPRSKKEELRALLGALSTLRARMAADLGARA